MSPQEGATNSEGGPTSPPGQEDSAGQPITGPNQTDANEGNEAGEEFGGDEPDGGGEALTTKPRQLPSSGGGGGDNPFAEEGEEGENPFAEGDEADEAEAADPGIEETDPVEQPDEVDHDAQPKQAALNRITAMAAEILRTNPEMGEHAFRVAAEVEVGLAASGVQRIAGAAHSPFESHPSIITAWLMNQLHGHPQRGGHGYSGRTPAPYYHGQGAYIHAPGTRYHGMEIPWLSPHTSQGTMEDRYHARNKVDPFRSTRLQEAMEVHLNRLGDKFGDWVDRKFNKAPSGPEDDAPDPQEPDGPPAPTEDNQGGKHQGPYRNWGDYAQSRIQNFGQDAARDYWHMRHSDVPTSEPMPKGHFGGDPSSDSENEEPHYAKRIKENPSATNAREDAMDEADSGDNDGDADDSGGSDSA